MDPSRDLNLFEPEEPFELDFDRFARNIRRMIATSRSCAISPASWLVERCQIASNLLFGWAGSRHCRVEDATAPFQYGRNLLAKPTLAEVKVLVVCEDFGFWELIVWVF